MAILLKILSFALWFLIMLAVIKAYRRTARRKTEGGGTGGQVHCPSDTRQGQ